MESRPNLKLPASAAMKHLESENVIKYKLALCLPVFPLKLFLNFFLTLHIEHYIVFFDQIVFLNLQYFHLQD